MNGLKRNAVISVLVVLVLLIGNLQCAWRSEQLQLSADQLSKLQGGSSFWKDPCTIDGFLFGISAGGCMMGNIFTCATAAGMLVKAWKTDNCF
jgi:hypothetical protein